jgi:chromosome partitioning protein
MTDAQEKRLIEVAWKRDAIGLFANSAYPLPDGTPKFLGTLIQRFNIRKGKAARPYRDNIAEIKLKVSTSLFKALSRAGMTLGPEEYAGVADDNYCLGEIPDFQGLLPKSYEAGVPVFEVTDAEIKETGPVLENFRIRRGQFREQFAEIGVKVMALIAHA